MPAAAVRVESRKTLCALSGTTLPVYVASVSIDRGVLLLRRLLEGTRGLLC